MSVSPAKVAGGKAKPAAKKVAPEHPKYADMVIAAVTELKGRKGVSLQAVKKHIIANNKVDETKCGTHIKLALKRLVIAKRLVQRSGTGASGSFNLGEKPKKVAKKPVVKAKKPAAKKAKKPAAKKPAAKKAATKKPVAKKPVVKKVAPKKKPAAKKPAAKKAKKAAA